MHASVPQHHCPILWFGSGEFSRSHVLSAYLSTWCYWEVVGPYTWWWWGLVGNIRSLGYVQTLNKIIAHQMPCPVPVCFQGWSRKAKWTCVSKLTVSGILFCTGKLTSRILTDKIITLRRQNSKSYEDNAFTLKRQESAEERRTCQSLQESPKGFS